MTGAWRIEQNPAARNAMAQILVNSRMAALGCRPLCQDTGVANVSARIGVRARLDWDRPLQDRVKKRAPQFKETRLEQIIAETIGLLEADGILLEQVLINLIRNGIELAGDGKP